MVPNSRWHTLAFLAGNGGRSPVYLGVEVDASAMLARRADTAAASIVAQVVAAVGTVWRATRRRTPRSPPSVCRSWRVTVMST
ncbi:hypothetical protein BJF84_07505 [Rhodococcus sp. CUA-806]|nr:hypothetical protein BJF84_07505 [Rhodococcus sp. CUA-806]